MAYHSKNFVDVHPRLDNAADRQTDTQERLHYLLLLYTSKT